MILQLQGQTLHGQII